MADNVVVSERGQITLPVALRKKLGITPGSVVLLEEKDGALVLRPAVVLPLHVYSDEEIERWLEADRFNSDAERERFDTALRGKLAQWAKDKPADGER